MARKKVEINPECGKRVAEFLKKRGKSQNDLARDLHYTPQQISRIVQGKCRLTEEVARRIVALYPGNDVTDSASYQWLMCETEYPTLAHEINAYVDNLHEAHIGINRVIEHHGCNIDQTYKVGLFDGDKLIRWYPIGMSINDVFRYEQERGQFQGKRSHLQLKDEGLHLATQGIIEVTVPGVGKRYITVDEWQRVIDEINKFIDYKLYSLFIESNNRLSTLLNNYAINKEPQT